MPEARRKSCLSGCLRGSDSGVAAGLLEHSPPLSRQGVERSSPRKQRSAAPHKDCSSHASTQCCCESTGGTIPEAYSENQAVPFQAGSSASPADRNRKTGISLRVEQAPDSVTSGQQKATDPLHKLDASHPKATQNQGRSRWSVSPKYESLLHTQL